MRGRGQENGCRYLLRIMRRASRSSKHAARRRRRNGRRVRGGEESRCHPTSIFARDETDARRNRARCEFPWPCSVLCYRGIITRRQRTINQRPSMMILCIAVAVALLDTLRYNRSASIIDAITNDLTLPLVVFRTAALHRFVRRSV